MVFTAHARCCCLQLDTMMATRMGPRLHMRNQHSCPAAPDFDRLHCCVRRTCGPAHLR